jgi:hypothetical protein
MYTEMHMSQQLQEKWKPIIEHPELPEIKDSYKKAVTAILLENQEKAAAEEAAMLNETNVVGGGMSPTAGGEGAIKGMDPVLISLVRRSMPNLMAYDLLGVQPMSGPTGLIFAMRSRYENQTGTEAFYNEADTDHSGVGTHSGTDPFAGGVITANALDMTGATQTTGTGGTTNESETLGDGTANNMGTNGHFNQMAFSIERITVTAKSRALKAEYTMELAQDLKAVHGLDAESELSNILSTEIMAEINREVIRTVYTSAKLGAAGQTNAGIFDLNQDADGRWSVEKFKGLLFQIEREANAIAKATRRGKGNMLLCSSDVASALAMAGVLDYNPALQNNITADDTGNTFAGVLNGKMKVYIDPYFDAAGAYEVACVGYKGTSPYDAGLFYCPYVPLQMVRAVGQDTFQPKIGFKTRYGIVANPFAQGATVGAGAISNRANEYYRIFRVDNLMS